MRRLTYLVLGASITLACSSGGAGSATQSGDAGPQPAPARRSRNVLLRTELTDVQQAEMNAYQALRQFRPSMLMGTNASTMGGGMTPGITVFLNNTKMGGLEALQNIRMIEVEKIEYLNGSEATMKFGTGYSGGALMVTKRR